VPDRALPTLHMRPFQLAKMHKNVQLQRSFFANFSGVIVPRPPYWEGLQPLQSLHRQDEFYCSVCFYGLREEGMPELATRVQGAVGTDVSAHSQWRSQEFTTVGAPTPSLPFPSSP